MTAAMDLRPGSERRRLYRPTTIETLRAQIRAAANDKGWRDRAACRDADPDLFFPNGPSDLDKIEGGKAVCAGCRARDECLGFAMETREPHGTFGGLTEWERQRLGAKWRQRQQLLEDWPRRARRAFREAGLDVAGVAKHFEVKETTAADWFEGTRALTDRVKAWVREQEGRQGWAT